MIKKFNDINKEKNCFLDELKQIAPHLFEDGKLNKQLLIDELNLFDKSFEERERERERFGIFWKGKNDAKLISNTPSKNTLRPNFDKSLNFDESDNIIIQGDNLEVLKILQKSYHKSIDVIYIDPPYNTGNDFIYNDSFDEYKNDYLKSTDQIDDDGNRLTTNQRSNGRFHSKWLSMIYPRLLVARTLLKDGGIIFISIDDNEYSRLKMICDEIFGEDNFQNTLCWISKKEGRQISNKLFAKTFEYILIYSKNQINIDNSFERKWISQLMPSIYENKELEIYEDDISQYIIQNELHNTNPKLFNSKTRKKLFFPIYINDKNEILLEKTDGAIEILPPKINDDLYHVWRWSKEKIKNDTNNLFVYRNKGKIKIFTKKRNIVFCAKDVIMSSKITTKSGGNDLHKLNINSFNFPKPIELIKFLLKNLGNNILVLDFFAGSGSTGQAVMELNNEDKGNRKYILIQLDEKIINDKFKSISEILLNRIENSINIFNYEEKGFKFFELVNSNIVFDNISINRNNLDQLSLDIFNQNTKTFDNNEINLIYEIFLKEGIKPTTKIIKIYKENDYLYSDETKTFIFMLNNSSLLFLKNEIQKIRKEKNNCGLLKVFLRDELLTDEDKINISEFASQIDNINNNIHIISI